MSTSKRIKFATDEGDYTRLEIEWNGGTLFVTFDGGKIDIVCDKLFEVKQTAANAAELTTP